MRNIILIAVITIGLSLASQADSLKHVDAETFLEKAKMLETLSSTDSTTFIGATWDRAYIEHTTIITFTHILNLKNKPSYTIYWVELKALPKNIVDKIRSGKSPWVPFNSRKPQKRVQLPPATNFTAVDLSQP